MRITWHPQAQEELVEAAKFYDRRVAGLGSDFIDAVEAAVRQIANDPNRFPYAEGNMVPPVNSPLLPAVSLPAVLLSESLSLFTSR
jgi:hypothetical protein